MKLNELLTEFEIYVTNEEADLLGTVGATPHPLSTYSDREQVILNNLIRKSLVSKIHNNGLYMVMKNNEPSSSKTT